MSLDTTGSLMLLYLDEIDLPEPVDAPAFLITGAAESLSKSERNWLPLVVKEVGDRYELIANGFTYAACEEAGLEKVWCVIADDKPETAETAQVLAGEAEPKINLSTADRDQISAALEYLVSIPGTPLKGLKMASAVNRIDESPRQYWNTLDPISKLGCAITKGKKLNTLKQVFFLTPQPLPEVIKDPQLLKGMTVSELKKQAKKRDIAGYSKMKKTDLIELLSQ